MKTRRNITLNPEVLKLAIEVMTLRHFDDFSGFIEQLIREEWERRNGSAKFSPVSAAIAAAEAAASVVTTNRASGGPRKT